MRTGRADMSDRYITVIREIFLKPCPFCGGNVGIYEKYDGDEYHKIHEIECGRCHLKMASNTFRLGYDGTEESQRQAYEMLVNAWNRRADDE